MGVTAEMTFVFGREKHARWAAHVAEGIIKVALARETSLDERLGTSHYGSLMEAFFAHEDELKAYDPVADDPHCALAWMSRQGTRLVVERCADIQGTFALRPSALDDEPFPQICLAYATRFPQVSFSAYCRFEQTTSGAVVLTRAAWDGERLRFRQHTGDLPFNENAWDTWDMLDLRFYEGAFLPCEEQASPLEQHYCALLDEAREACSAGDVAGALYFADAAEALPGCSARLEAALLRGFAGEQLRRCGVRRVRELWTREVPEELRVKLAAADPVSEMPLGGGRFVLRAHEGSFEVIDASDGSKVGEGNGGFNRDPTYVIHDFLVLSGGRFYLIDWEYVVEPPLANMW